jgi:hypothetical protein
MRERAPKNWPKRKIELVDNILRCKVDGYRAFDRREFARHMACHSEELLVEVKEIHELPPLPDVPLTEPPLTASKQLGLANETVTLGMANLFGDEDGNV